MKNLEAKLHLNALSRAESRATALGYARRAILNQRDTFFKVPNGKLKLREENSGAALIFYQRNDSRLHLDRVSSLGDFGEIEAVIAEGDDPELSRAAVDELLAALEIIPASLIDVSYFEMLA